MQITLFRSGVDASASASGDLSWSEITSILNTFLPHQCRLANGECIEKKRGRAWGPYTLSVARRATAHVDSITALVFDVDHVSDSVGIDLVARLDAHKYAYVIHSTHSHTPPDDCCFRIVIPLAEPLRRSGRTNGIFGAELLDVRAEIIETLGIPADPATGDLSRQYFLPVAIEGRSRGCDAAEGSAIDTKALLATIRSKASLPKLSTTAVAPPPDVTPLDPDAPEDLNEMRIKLRRIRFPESRGLILSALKGEALAQAGGRDNAINRLASIIAGALPQASCDAALALIVGSIAAMPVDPEGFEYWRDRFRECFERARLRATDFHTHRERIQRETRHLFLVEGSTAPQASASPEANADVLDPVRSRLLYTTRSDGSQSVAKSGANAAVILEYAPEWCGVLHYNLLTKTIEATNAPCEGANSPNTLPTWVGVWLSQSEYRLDLPTYVVADALLAVARKKAYDPIADYLNTLVWDGRPRIDRMLEDSLGAVTIAPDRDITPYVRAVSARWMISAVARGLNPGCQVDTVLILESERQGLGKTSAIRVLGGEWSRSTNIDLRDKDARLAAGSAWIIELSELDSFSKADKALAKGFFTDTIDQIRPPYGRAVESYPRHCVFVGTTNETGYLTDHENRRYWPITLGRPVDLERLTRERDQLWAEAVARYKAGEIYHFPLGDSLWAVAADETDDRREADPWAAQILEWWTRARPINRPAYVTGYQVACEALSLTAAQADRRTQMRISAALKDLGFSKMRKESGGRKIHAYVPPENLRDAPQEAPTVSTAAAVGAIETSKGSK